MTGLHSALIIAVVAIVTVLIRFSPFIIFKNKVPKVIEYLSSVLPYAVIGMLVIYCLKDISFKAVRTCLPQLISVAVTAVIHKVGHKTLLSIISGTVCYMVLINIL